MQIGKIPTFSDQRWVDAKSGSPNPGKYVWIRCQDGFTGLACFDCSVFSFDSFGASITHWMYASENEVKEFLRPENSREKNLLLGCNDKNKFNYPKTRLAIF